MARRLDDTQGMGLIPRLFGRSLGANQEQGIVVEHKDALPMRADGHLFQQRHATFSDQTPANFFKRGYKHNSAVFACVRTLANAVAEAELIVTDGKGRKVENHPVKQLFVRPNQIMGEDEFWKYVITYSSVGGAAFGHKVRSRAGKVVELWPYSPAAIGVIPGGPAWVECFRYDLGMGQSLDLPTEDIIHWKWAVDPERPWDGMSALASVMCEVDADTELTRTLKSLLENDAMPLTALVVPQGSHLSETEYQRLKRQFVKRFGGSNKGSVAVLEGGTDVKRMSLNMQELAFDTIRSVPEARIAAAFGVPAIVAGLNIGLARSTYSNYEEARKAFTEQTLVPLWRALAAEVQSAFADELAGLKVEFDLNKVEALRPNLGEKATWVVAAYEKGILQRNEARVLLTMESIQGEDVFAAPPAPKAPQAAGNSSAPMDTPPAGNEAQKAAWLLDKAAPHHEQQAADITAEMEKRVREYLLREYAAVADHVEQGVKA